MGSKEFKKLSTIDFNSPEFSQTNKHLLSTFLLHGETQINKTLFKGIDKTGLINLAEYITPDKQSLQDMIIQTVLGGTDKVPMKAIAFFLPAIQLAKELLATVGSDNMPKVTYAIADGSGILLNKMDEGEVKHTSSLIFNTMKEYIKQFHPELEQHISFYRDEEFTKGILEDVYWKKIFPDMIKEVEKHPKLLKRIEGFADMNGGKNTVFAYSFLHPFEHDVVIDKETAPALHTNFFTGEHGLPSGEIILTTGAIPEQEFYKMRKAILPAFNLPYVREVKDTMLMTNFETAPYYMLRKTQDMALETAIDNPSELNHLDDYDPVVQFAYDTIKADTQDESGQAFSEFLNSLNSPEFKEKVNEGGL